MDFSKLASCASLKDSRTENFSVGRGALSDALVFSENYRNILLVCDENTYTACGRSVLDILGEKIASSHVFKRQGVLIPDEDAVFELEAAMPSDTDFIVGVGSGVINDICKFVSFRKGIEYMIIATAPSMDGYVSKGAAMIWKGMKETFSTHTPLAVIGDTEILANAPMDMIRAGYGDIIGKYSALCDWKLASLVHGEYFDADIYDYTMDMVKKTEPLAQKLLERDPESIGVLMEALIGAGVAMACLGNSRPASGSEHHLSHFFEITGIISGTDYLCHGIDVAFATWMTAAMREKILEVKEFAPGNPQPRDKYEKEIRRVYGKVADEVIALQDKMGRYSDKDVAQTHGVYAQKWDEIKKILAEMPSADRIRELLDLIGLDVNLLYKTYSVSHLKDAYRYAKDLKDRYTVLWLYNTLFGDTLSESIPSSIYTGGFGKHHIQGIAADTENGFLYCSFTTSLLKLDLLGNKVGSVDGIIGHLGCLAFGENSQIFGSLEYKNDAIGKGILKGLQKDSTEEGFYVVRFFGDKIDRMHMDAEKDLVMEAAFLPEVLGDFTYMDENITHKYGCSGIDGISIGPDFGDFSDQKYVCVCYGIYGDTSRSDNDRQVILQYSFDELEKAFRSIDQSSLSRIPARHRQKYFVYTGNTTYGVQNLEYDPATGLWFMAVYPGKKENFPNYKMYVIDGSVPPFEDENGDMTLTLLDDGIYHEESGVYGYVFPYGSTGMQALGGGYFLFSKEKKNSAGLCASDVELYRFVGQSSKLFDKN